MILVIQIVYPQLNPCENINKHTSILRLHPCNVCLPEVISMTVKASNFHPDVITFRWFCQGGELSPVASQAQSSPRPNAEGFFSAYSQCKLPCSELERGGTKVWVSVHHIALKQPVTRETRGARETPKLDLKVKK